MWLCHDRQAQQRWGLYLDLEWITVLDKNNYISELSMKFFQYLFGLYDMFTETLDLTLRRIKLIRGT